MGRPYRCGSCTRRQPHHSLIHFLGHDDASRSCDRLVYAIACCCLPRTRSAAHDVCGPRELGALRACASLGGLYPLLLRRPHHPHPRRHQGKHRRKFTTLFPNLWLGTNEGGVPDQFGVWMAAPLAVADVRWPMCLCAVGSVSAHAK